MEIVMQTYENAIQWIARSMFHHHMSGGEARHGLSGCFAIAFVYGFTPDQVESDAQDAYSIMIQITAEKGIDNV